jgi:hypothetical protein
MSIYIRNNPLRKALNLEQTRKRLNSNINKYSVNLEKERKYIKNNPGGLPNQLSAAQRKMLYYNDMIARLKHQRNNLHGGKKRKTRRNIGLNTN